MTYTNVVIGEFFYYFHVYDCHYGLIIGTQEIYFCPSYFLLPLRAQKLISITLRANMTNQWLLSQVKKVAVRLLPELISISVDHSRKPRKLLNGFIYYIFSFVYSFSKNKVICFKLMLRIFRWNAIAIVSQKQ